MNNKYPRTVSNTLKSPWKREIIPKIKATIRANNKRIVTHLSRKSANQAKNPIINAPTVSNAGASGGMSTESTNVGNAMKIIDKTKTVKKII